jgi:hypothetical protein
MKPEDVKPGDELYIGTSLYIDHGEDDVCGGIAVVEEIIYKPVPANPVNSWFADFVGIDGHRYNLSILLERQDELREEYGDRIAHNCPDVPGHKCPNLRRSITAEQVLEIAGKNKVQLH